LVVRYFDGIMPHIGYGEKIKTYPHHWHYECEDNVREINPEETDENTLRKIMWFIRRKLSGQAPSFDTTG